ncbi:MAG: DNA topoisomerase IV [Dokdonia sp.]|jgi:hypothetical protein|nr:DNA topoisomerase IV [Cytophagaceae bacterium]
MLKHLPFGFLLFLLFCSCESPERDCAQFKTGDFTFETLLEGSLTTTYFSRNDTLEIATINGKPDSSNVRWINDCEYIVTKRNPKNRSEKQAVHMKILYTEGNSYTFEYSLVGKARKEQGLVTKVK